MHWQSLPWDLKISFGSAGKRETWRLLFFLDRVIHTILPFEKLLEKAAAVSFVENYLLDHSAFWAVR